MVGELLREIFGECVHHSSQHFVMGQMQTTRAESKRLANGEQLVNKE